MTSTTDKLKGKYNETAGKAKRDASLGELGIVVQATARMGAPKSLSSVRLA